MQFFCIIITRAIAITTVDTLDDAVDDLFVWIQHPTLTDIAFYIFEIYHIILEF